MDMEDLLHDTNQCLEGHAMPLNLNLELEGQVLPIDSNLTLYSERQILPIDTNLSVFDEAVLVH